jgi:hypothetical protein
LTPLTRSWQSIIARRAVAGRSSSMVIAFGFLWQFLLARCDPQGRSAAQLPCF